MDKAFYDMLIQNAAEASKRARWILSLAIVISLIQIGALYNFGYSDTREYVESLVFNEGLPEGVDKRLLKPLPAGDDEDQELGIGNDALKELRKEMIKSWVDEQTFSVSLLGIKLHATDVGLFGSLALVTVVVWMYYAVRRENRLMAAALRTADKESPRTKAHVFYALAGSQMFATLTPHDEHDDDGPQDTVFVRHVGPCLVTLLMCLPLLTMLAMIWIDYQVVFKFKSVHRGFEGSFHTLKRGDVGPWYQGTFALEVLGAILIAWMVYLTLRLQRDTRKRLEAKRAAGWSRTEPGEPQPTAATTPSGTAPPRPHVPLPPAAPPPNPQSSAPP